MSLLHHNDGGVKVSAARVCLEVLLCGYGRGLLLLLIGILPYPEEDLWRVPGVRPSSPPWPTGRCLSLPQMSTSTALTLLLPS